MTVLVGPNASGKSNVVDVLRFIGHSLRRGLDAAITSRQGIGAVRRSKPKGRPYDVEVGFRAKKGRFSIDYGFVLGSRSGGIYYVKREHCVVTPADQRGDEVEFERSEDRIVKPSDAGALYDEDLDATELAFRSLARYILLRPFEGSGPGGRRPSHVNQTYRDVIQAVESISGMRSYRMFPDTMREPRRPRDPRRLREDGSNLASVLKEMSRSPNLGEIEEALARVVPGLSGLQVQQSGGYLVVKLRHQAGDGSGSGSFFDLSQESDGTVRLLGLLVALYQENTPPLIGIEEPELTIHPGALAALADILVETTHRAQALVTTHSPDLIDRLPIEYLRAVDIEDGCTRVGPVSETQAEAVRAGLFTSGELHSMEGLEPRA